MGLFGKTKPKEVKSDGRQRVRETKKLEDLYSVKEELGKGGFAVVHRGIDKEDQSVWAVKMIKQQVFRKNKEQTEAEVQVMTSLSHPGVVQVREVVKTEKYHCIVMELLSGGELFDRIVQREKYTESDAKKVAKALLEAVGYMHANQIVHRDLKPENIIFSNTAEESPLKITDFGFAAVTEGRNLTQACGTPEYVAPEILDEKPYNESVDMWSLGVIFYILLCGFPPFYGDSDEDLFEMICTAKYEFLSPYWDKASKESKDLISNCLTLDPKKRLTAPQALKHKWFDDLEAGGDLGDTLGQMTVFNSTRKLRKGVLMVIAANKITRAINAV